MPKATKQPNQSTVFLQYKLLFVIILNNNHVLKET